jgi:threonine synthase
LTQNTHIRPVGASKNSRLERSEFFSSHLGCNVFVWDASKSQTGTIKDWRARELLYMFRYLDYDVVAAITSGNTGYSLGHWALKYGLSAFSIVDAATDERIVQKLGEVSTVICTNLSERMLTSKDVISLVHDKIVTDKTTYSSKIVDATNTDSWLDSYFAICSEIFIGVEKMSGGFRPHQIIVPVGSGELFISLDMALAEFESDALLTGVTVRANPLAGPKATGSSSLADKLSTSYLPLAPRVEQILKRDTREIMVAEETEIAEMYALLRKRLQQPVEPSSAAAFVALERLKDRVEKSNNIVVVNTGRGLYFD